MKYCAKCGQELMDEAVVCTACGCMVETEAAAEAAPAKKESVLKTVAKILMIISTVAYGFTLLPLAWMLPMTITYCKKVKNNQPISTGFKVCILIFVNLISGVLLLCDND